MQTLTETQDRATAETFAAHWVGSLTRRPKPSRVLVVDDDAASRALCVLTLLLAGYDVVDAGDCGRDLEVARSERPDLALLGIRMPGLDGFELATAIRRGMYLLTPYEPDVLEWLVALAVGDHSPDDATANEGSPAWPDHAASH